MLYIYDLEPSVQGALYRHRARARAAGSLLQYGITPADRARMDATMQFSVKVALEKWSRQLLKMPIGYVGYVGYNIKLPYIWVRRFTRLSLQFSTF